MIKRILLSICLCWFAAVAQAAFPQFTELFDFTGNVTDDANWDVEENSTDTPTADGNRFVTADGQSFKGYNCIYQDTCDSVDQCVVLHMYDVEGGHGTFGAILREANADGTGAHYEVAVRWSGSAWQFSCDRATGMTYGELIGSRTNVTAPADGDRLGFAVRGTGDDTVFEFWNFGATDPGDFSTWGTPDVTNTANPTTAVDTGSYCGIRSFFAEGSANGDHLIETWWGGDQAAAGGVSVAVLRRRMQSLLFGD